MLMSSLIYSIKTPDPDKMTKFPSDLPTCSNVKFADIYELITVLC